MNAWKTLYIKELKDNRSVFLFLIVATLALDLYGYFRALDGLRPSPYAVLVGVPFLAAFILPFLLIHTFSQEFRAQTHYQLLSLPVSRAAVVVCKFLAVLSLGVALYGIATGTLHLLYLKLTASAAPDDGIHNIGADSLWKISGLFYFTVLLLLMGIASAMAGIKLVVRRFQGLVMTVFFLGSLYLYGRSLVWLIHLQARAVLGLDEALSIPLLPTVLLFPSVLPFTLLFALLFLGLGILLFERYAEA